MNSAIPFQTINWDNVPVTNHKGETGMAFWQTLQYPGLRIRMVTYSKGYLADHWCSKGHIVHCLQGTLISELQTGETFTLAPCMTYVVSDELSSHCSVTTEEVKLLIIDGDFLKQGNGNG
jgi:quercetin dioxygenase-like cupin family protein